MPNNIFLNLWFSVFKRLVTLIADHARITASGEASLAQARSATEVAQRLLSQPPPTELDSDVGLYYTFSSPSHHYHHQQKNHHILLYY